MGLKLYKSTLFRELANFEEQAVLTDGQTVDRPYRADVAVENYTKGTALSAQDLTATSDQLTVDVIKAALVYVDNVDKIQNKYSAANAWADEIGRRLAISLDARFLYQAFSATDTIDDGDVGGTAGNGITATVNNIDDIFAAINMKLDVNNNPEDSRFFVISPQLFKVLWLRVGGKQSELGDKTSQTGNVGTYAGLKLFKSNNLTGSARWTPGDSSTPTAGETLTINGITFTWQTTIGSTAGNVLAVTNMATSIDNLVALINNGGATSDSGVSNVSLSAANQRTVQDWVAVDGTTYIEVRAMGASYMTVSGSQVADVWTTTQQLQNCLAGVEKCIDVVVQKNPDVEMASTVSAGKSGMNILGLTLAGFGTFNLGKAQMFKVQLRSDAY